MVFHGTIGALFDAEGFHYVCQGFIMKRRNPFALLLVWFSKYIRMHG